MDFKSCGLNHIRRYHFKMEINEISQRLLDCRTMTGLTRTEFCKQNGLSIHSLASWETGRKLFSKKMCLILVESLHRYGVSVTLDWIFYGKGARPEKKDLTNAFQQSPIHFSEEDKVWNEVKLFRSQYANAITYTVQDNTANPFFFPQDILGSVGLVEFHELKRLQNKICIIELKDDTVLLRKIKEVKENNKVNIELVNEEMASFSPIAQEVEVKMAGEVLWFRRLFKQC